MKTRKTLSFNFIAKVAVLIVTFFVGNVFSQEFSTTTATPYEINNASQNSACSSNKSISFTINDIGTLTPDKQLLEIRLDIKTHNGGFPRLAYEVYLQAPDGTCHKIAEKLGTSSIIFPKEKQLDYTFRAPNACLNKKPDYGEDGAASLRNYAYGVSGNAGVVAMEADISSVLNGINADGTWKLFFTSTNSSYQTIGSVTGASLIFGSPLDVPPPNTSLGTSCADAYHWDGGPVCLTTEGKTQTSFTPGNSPCGWYETLENTLWIKFTPTEEEVCINVSGINNSSGGTYGLQSIIVEPNNPGSPCTTNWTVKSCPRNSEIYTSASGTSSNHNHCFNAEPGKTYYLVVDGNGGAESNIYLTGIDGLPIILPVELLDFSATCVDNKSIEFEWNTASETYNDFFTIQHSIDGEKWKEVAQIEGAGHATSKNNYQYIDRNHYSTNINYFRLIQTDFDGTQEILKTISLVNCQTDNKAKILAVPNP